MAVGTRLVGAWRELWKKVGDLSRLGEVLRAHPKACECEAIRLLLPVMLPALPLSPPALWECVLNSGT
jgi:hypothetical protein